LGQQDRNHNSYLHIRQPIIYQDITYGTIYVLVSVDLLVQKIKDHLLTMLIILIISLVLAYLLAINLQKSISDPILKITSIAENISVKEDYSIRIKDISNDEIGVLSTRFNEMLHKIEERQNERDKAENALRYSEKQLKESIEHEKNNSYELMLTNKKLEEAQYESQKMLHDLKLEIKKRIKAEKRLSDHKLKLEETVSERTKSLESETKKLKVAQNVMLDLINEKEESRLHIEQANKSLLEVNKELEAFSYSVSHDLRAPVRAIEGFTIKLLKEIGKSTTDEEKRLVSIITANTSKMGKLIDDLLEFSRMNRGELNKLNVDMKTIVTEICNNIKEENQDYNLEFVIDELPVANCDSRLIKQVWINLISNSAKFSKNKSLQKIHIGSDNIEGKTTFFVKDNGAGFNMEYSNKLFQVFQRLHTDAEFEGTGIGLAIVDRVIKRHGGRIWCSSKENIETIFYFTLT